MSKKIEKRKSQDFSKSPDLERSGASEGSVVGALRITCTGYVQVAAIATPLQS